MDRVPAAGAGTAGGTRSRQARVGAPLLAVTAVTALVLGTLLGWLAFAPHHPGDDSPEAGFARDMSEHHSQAVEMALLVMQRSQDPSIATLAFDIATSQGNQIGQMEGWLRTWGLPTARDQERMAWMADADVHAGHSGRGGPGAAMPGMATQAEMEQLREASGEEAEVLFLQLMTAHHGAGVDMAQAAVDLVEEPEVLRLARAMVNGQQSEIAVMADLLRERGDAAPERDTGPPEEPHGDH